MGVVPSAHLTNSVRFLLDCDALKARTRDDYPYVRLTLTLAPVGAAVESDNEIYVLSFRKEDCTCSLELDSIVDSPALASAAKQKSANA